MESAEERATALLNSFLTHKQRQEWATAGYFHVTSPRKAIYSIGKHRRRGAYLERRGNLRWRRMLGKMGKFRPDKGDYLCVEMYTSPSSFYQVPRADMYLAWALMLSSKQGERDFLEIAIF